MSDNKVTLDQLDNSAVEAMTSSVGDVSMLNTENKTIVGALAEIVGKKEIANAIGEPLAETDKFTEMSSEINGLLSTFKTNMMNAGVVVESGDKFKALIDKIKGLTEGEGNKGVQYVEGIVTRDTTHAKNFNDIDGYSSSGVSYIVLPKLNFEPTLLIAMSNNPSDYYPVVSLISYDYNFNTLSAKSALFSGSVYDGLSYNFKADELVFLEDSIHLPVYNGKTTTFNWCAIGVGEEDTTLRDSLADILENKGVDVTEEDDMASLIGKVDEEFDKSKIKQLITTGYNIRSGGYGTVGVFAIMDNGELWACGANTNGKLGLGDTANRRTFEKVNISDIKEIICGPSVTYIIKNDGSAWGCGSVSLLGIEYSDDEITTFTQLPEPVNTNVKEISCGEGYTMILKNDGTLWGIGYNNFGSLGLGDRNNAGTFTQATVNADNIRHVECKGAITFIYKNDGSVWFAGFTEDYAFGELSSYNQQQTTFYQLL